MTLKSNLDLADRRPPGEKADSPAAPCLRGMTKTEMIGLLEPGGFPPYRASQLYHWIYRRGAESLGEMANLPEALREWVGARVRVGGIDLLEIKGPEKGTRKIVFELSGASVIESVLMRDEGKGRTSLCVSSQVGCAVGCTFCLTGYGGFQRHCTTGEIVAQVLHVRRHLCAPQERLHTVVFMGMGEPMLNVEAVVKAIGLLADGEGLAISPRRITVSTAGVVPGIEAFGQAQTGANLAVSLNATTDEIRTSIMPLNQRWPISELIEACRTFPMKPRQRITVEYVLLKGINDSLDDARRLVRLLRPVRCKVNLIMFNPHKLLKFEPTTERALNRFAKTLAEADYTVAVRWSKGREIEAACGQLAAHAFFRKAD